MAKKETKKKKAIKETEEAKENNHIEEGKEKKPDKHETQLKWILIFMAGALLLAVFAYWVVQESKKFSYGGLDYEITKTGKDILLYHTKIPIKDYQGKVLANYNLYLRNDPRDLREIGIKDSIMLKTDTIISLSKEAETGCSDSGIAGGNFFGFLKTGGIKTNIAYSDEEYAKEKNMSYVACDSNLSSSIIMIKKGEENSITMPRKDCYVLEFKDCDILKVTERFMCGLYAQSKGINI